MRRRTIGKECKGKRKYPEGRKESTQREGEDKERHRGKWERLERNAKDREVR